jgi:hypothetical protein
VDYSYLLKKVVRFAPGQIAIVELANSSSQWNQDPSALINQNQDKFDQK